MKNGFFKFLTSTKFQVAILGLGLILLLVGKFKGDPNHGISTIRDVALGYFGARILEPVVEFMLERKRQFQNQKKED